MVGVSISCLAQDGHRVVVVDFDEFEPIDKKLAECELNHVQGKKVVLYVAAFCRLRCMDVVEKTFDSLQHRFQLGLFLVGGFSYD